MDSPSRSGLADAELAQLRELCLALPEVTERLSHGEPTWFAGKSFVMFADHHHDDRIGFWCAAGDGVQQVLAAAQPDRYYRPPYVGTRGWLGVYLDVDIDWDEVGDLVIDAYRCIANKRQLAALQALLAERV